MLQTINNWLICLCHVKSGASKISPRTLFSVTHGILIFFSFKTGGTVYLFLINNMHLHFRGFIAKPIPVSQSEVTLIALCSRFKAKSISQIRINHLHTVEYEHLTFVVEY